MQMNILLQLLDYIIDPGRMPFPTKKDLSKRIGVTEKTIQNNIRGLEKRGFLMREARRTAAGDWNSNVYHLDGLIEMVKALEPDYQKAKEDKTKARKAPEKPLFRAKR